MVSVYHSFLIHSSADGHLGCFHVLAVASVSIVQRSESAVRIHIGGGCICWVAQSCLTLWPPGLQPARRLYSWASQATVLEWVGIFSCSPGIETKSPVLAGISFTTEPLGKPTYICMCVCK